MCNLILRSVANCESKVVVDLYKLYVRPVLEYCCVVEILISCIWLIYMKMSKNILSDVFVKNSNFSYLQKLDSLNFEPVKIILKTNYLVFMYKYLNSFINTIYLHLS